MVDCQLAGSNMQPTNMNPNSRPTFAEQTKKKIQPITTFSHPTEEQGIIFHHVEGTKVREYLVAIYQLVGGASNIIAASRVSGGRVIVFLANKDIVEKFQTEYGGFYIQNTFIKTRKLKTPSQKLIISNVSPTVPNLAIEELLTKTLKMKLASPISILRVSPQDDLFSHVVSWRRQVYVQSVESLPHLPESVQLTYAERTYRVFLTLDDFACFKCGSRGHKAEDCIGFLDGDFDDIQEHSTPTPSKIAKNLEDFPGITHGNATLRPLKLTEPTKSIPLTPQQTKRGPSTLDSSDLALTEEIISKDTQADIVHSTLHAPAANKRQKIEKEQNKKPLTLTPVEKAKIEERIEKINTTKVIDCDITSDNLLVFLQSVRGHPNKADLAKELTSNIGNLLYILEEIKPEMEPGTKKTISALTKKLRKTSAPTTSDLSESD